MFTSVIAKLSLRSLQRGVICIPSICKHRSPLSTSSLLAKDLRIAIIGQSVFGQEVYKVLREQGRNIVGIFTVPDQNGRPDPLAVQADEDGVPLFKFKRWRSKGK